jgi:hypothetical protein
MTEPAFALPENLQYKAGPVNPARNISGDLWPCLRICYTNKKALFSFSLTPLPPDALFCWAALACGSSYPKPAACSTPLFYSGFPLSRE